MFYRPTGGPRVCATPPEMMIFGAIYIVRPYDYAHILILNTFF